MISAQVKGVAEVPQARPLSSRIRIPAHSELLSPNALVRWAFYLSIFSIPFLRLYVPGTGERVGVTRLIQLLLLGALLSQPRICLRLVPVALFWFVAYCALRIACGFLFAPELFSSWWPSTLEWLQYSLPWVWILFNLLQFPQLRRAGLWAFAGGCALCACLHIIGIGVKAVDNNVIVRTTVFGENANLVGAIYAMAVVIIIGLNMLKDFPVRGRLLCLPMVVILALGLAKTGSRTAILMLGIGIFVLLFQARSFLPRAKRYTTLAVIGLIFAAVLSQVPTVLQRFEQIQKSKLSHVEGRVRMMPVLVEIFLRSPIYGTGPDKYQMELTRRAMPYLLREQRTIAAHNLVLLLLVETGIIGLLIFSGGMQKALASAWKGRLGAGGYLPLAMLLPFLVSAMVLSDPTHSQVFWLAIAYALAGTA
jgi:O-antigen ligase